MNNENRINTASLRAMLSARYSGEDCALLHEVPESTGGGNRRADAVGMTLWKSRGHRLMGFELKVSRADWLKELKAPAKAESICSYCDEWWIVAGSAAIIKDGELPDTWGLMVPRGERLHVVKHAPRLSDPKPISREFLAALFRCSQKQAISDEERRAAWKEGHTAGVNWQKQQGAEVEKHLHELRDAVAKFSEESGVHISRWGNGNIGEAVRLITSGGIEGRMRRYAGIVDEMEKHVKLTREQFDQMQSAVNGAAGPTSNT